MQLQQETQPQSPPPSEQAQQVQEVQQVQQMHHVQSVHQIQPVQNQGRGFINIKIQNPTTASQVIMPPQMQPMQPMPPMQPMQPMMGGSYPRVINSYPHPHMHQPVSVSNAPTPQVSQVRVLNTSSSQPLSQLKRSSHQIYQGSAVYMSPTMVIQPSSPIRSQYMGSPVNQQKI
jgi:hypothetical protein